jgi:hypothetical protein
MIGQKKLSEVRERLAAALAMPEGARVSEEGRSDVAVALERFQAGQKSQADRAKQRQKVTG